MKKLTFLIMLLSCILTNAQEVVYIYNADGTKEYFKTNNTIRYIQYKESAKKNIQKLCSNTQKIDTIMPDILKITLKESDVIKFDKEIFSLDSIFFAKELIYTNDGTIQWCFNNILLQPKEDIEIENILKEYKIPYISYKSIGLAENEYLLELSVSEALYFANLLYETGLFNYAVPSFYRDNIFKNPLYYSQWGLKNTGQNCKPTGIGRDINVEPAWSFSTGKGIIVAVVDDGVQLNHPDLANNLLQGYDALGHNNNGSYSNFDNHGTCCAGIISAEDNTIGIKGVAFEAKIVPIRIGAFGRMNDTAIIKAFEYIYQNNIDVVSCSWGGGPNSPTITNAINAVATNGRGGLGCPILFSSGNKDSSSISYPASLANTIAVGAMSPCGERKNPNSCDGESWGSNYGSGLDVVAPGVLIPTTTINNGYNLSFNGTSSACPHAAGVMALILSANPCLTATEAREILCSTCDKLSGYSYNYNEEYGSWNTEVGYGKINAFKAVTKTMNISPRSYTLSGISGSPYNLSRWVLLQQSCNVSSGTYLRVKRYEVVRDITFPYMENPIVYAVANGYSAANPNDGQPFCGVLNLTHTSAQLKTWVYYISYSINGQQINTYIPTTPQNIRFNTTIYEIPETNIYINNKSVVNTEYNRNALQNIETTNFSTQGSSIVKLRAGKEIIFGNGTEISPNSSGNFYAFIESFDICENNKATPIVSNPLEKEKKNYTNPEIANSVIQPIEETSFATENPTLSIYPNPTNGTFHIKLENTEEFITQVYINNMLGTEMFRKNNLQNDESINIATLPAGLYVVNVITNSGKIYFGKLVKQ